MAGELTTQFAAGPPFKEGPLGFDGVGGVAIAVLDFPRTVVDLLMRQGCLGEPMLPSEFFDCRKCSEPRITDEDIPLRETQHAEVVKHLCMSTGLPTCCFRRVFLRAFRKFAFETEGLRELTEVAVAVCIEERLSEVSEINVERVVADHVEHVNQGVVMELKQSDGQDERIEDADWKIETYRLRQTAVAFDQT